MLEETVSIEFNRQVQQGIWLMGFRSEYLASHALPGQFLMIREDKNSKDPLLRRPFSVHEIRGRDTVTILYKIVGKGTSLFAGLKKHDAISVIGPLGNGFTLPSSDAAVVLVAGGMGIAPLFHLAQVLKKVRKNHIKLFLGFSTNHDIVCIDEFKNLGVDLSITTEDGSLGSRGIVTDLFDQYVNQGLTQKPVIYACGPTPLLKKVAQKAVTSDLRCYVSLEGQMACGLGICLGCAVKATHDEGRHYYYVCQDGPVFTAEMIEWEAV